MVALLGPPLSLPALLPHFYIIWAKHSAMRSLLRILLNKMHYDVYGDFSIRTGLKSC